MKKIAISVLAMVLMLALACGTAFALTGDITTKAVKAYADPDMTDYVGTIPKYTSVMVRAYGSYADIYVSDIECYINPSALTCGNYDHNYIGTATLKKGAVVHQRPSSSSYYLTNRRSRRVLVYALTNGYALVRTRVGGVFGFVKASSLKSLKAK